MCSISIIRWDGAFYFRLIQVFYNTANENWITLTITIQIQRGHIMVGIILLVMGVIFMGAGLFAGNMIGGMMGSVPGSAQGIMGMSQTIFTVAFVGVGALLAFFGLISLMRSRRSSAMAQKVLANGIPGEAKITFVDRNYGVLINNRPIYSIVEYVYADGLGNQYSNRMNNVSSELVIRAGWQVGTSIPIKYLSEDPTQSAIVMA